MIDNAIIFTRESLAKHDSNLLDKVAEKLKERTYYMETEEGWGGYTVSDKDIDEVIAELKADIGVTENV